MQASDEIRASAAKVARVAPEKSAKIMPKFTKICWIYADRMI